MKLNILAIGVHPDDVELGCSGSILKHISLGYTVGIIDLTKGELGTRGNAELRFKEALEAAKILGVTVRENLGYADGFFQNDQQHLLPLIEKIRFYQPDIVFGNAFTDRHPDHGRAGKLISDACYCSGLLKVETFHDETRQLPWRPKAVYHYVQDRYQRPDIVVDITEFLEKKFESIKAFSSQFYNPDSKEPVTPISGEEFFEVVKSRAIDYGRQIGVKYAEGFVAERYVGVNNLFDLL
jgi:N-acetylglucosamine malate deacetylase 1